MSTQAVAKSEQTAVEATDFLAALERLAVNPNVDPAKIGQFLDMKFRVMAHEAKVAYARALSEMQPEMPVIEKRGRINISKDKDAKGQPYALWDDINEAIKPVLQTHGFSLSFRTGVSTDGKITVTGILSHKEGHQEETTITLPHDSTGSKNPVQAVGSSTSYGKRYTAGALLNLTFKGEDDDGEKGGSKGLTEEQVQDLQQLIIDVDIPKDKVLAFAKVAAIADIPATDYDRVVVGIKGWAAKKAQPK